MRDMHRRFVAVTVAVVLAVALAPLPGQAQLAIELKVVQAEGYAALSWTAAPGVTEYVIERTPVNAQDLPTGLPAIAGVWRPNRQVRPQSPTFADAGFNPGDRFQWRVHAVPGVGLPSLSSAAVGGTTLASSGPNDFLTQFELTLAAQWTSHESELEWTQRIDAASDRVRVVEIGRTVLGRPINLFVVGYPAPLGTAEEIARSPSVSAGCNVHGNEPSGREGCFMMIRRLAFSDDPWVVDILSNATVLIIPSLNGDGRAANTRGNTTGQDLNRDYGRLSQPEPQAMVRFWRDYTPDVMVDHHEFGEATTCDLSLMVTPHLNNAQAMYEEARFGLLEGWTYDHAATEGWWPCPYPVAFSPGGQSFGSTAGLKHVVGMLIEARSPAGPTRPDETSTQGNRRRAAYSQLWALRQAMDYHRANLPTIQQAIADSIAFQLSNTGRVVFNGTYDWEPSPPPHPGESPPPNNQPGPEDVLDDPPCGYLLSDAQYTTLLSDGGSLPEALRTSPAQRLEAHGIHVERRDDGYFVPMAQPLRGLIPLILDGQTQQLGAPIIVAADRIDDCA